MTTVPLGTSPLPMVRPALAARVASERGGKLGAEVGYQIRFDDHTSVGTRICFVTEGILLRWLQDDRALSKIGAVVFDEFHERNLLSDVALALVKHLQQSQRPDLVMLVMSATLDAEPVAAYLDPCPILVSEGQSFPVEVGYLSMPDQRPITVQAAEAVARRGNGGREAGGPGCGGVLGGAWRYRGRRVMGGVCRYRGFRGWAGGCPWDRTRGHIAGRGSDNRRAVPP